MPISSPWAAHNGTVHKICSILVNLSRGYIVLHLANPATQGYLKRIRFLHLRAYEYL